MEQNTHPRIDPSLVGVATSLGPGWAEAELVARAEMSADDRGLVHGGFTFGLADFAAMLAVNDPHVVLGAAETRFLAPVKVGQTMCARAEVESEAGKKRSVTVTVMVGETPVMRGVFTCFVLGAHVFDA